MEVKPEPTGKNSAGKTRGGKNNAKDAKGVRSRPESQVSIIYCYCLQNEIENIMEV